jgi:hypothetical protein
MRLPIAAVLACLAPLGVAPAASAALPFRVNLLHNGGAETGGASSNGEALVPIPRWAGTLTVNAYGGSNGPPNFWVFPPLSEAQRIGGGKQFFAGGAEGGTLAQPIDMAWAAEAIDLGVVTATLSGWLGGFLSQRDPGTVEAQFFDNGSTQLGRAVIGPVEPGERGNDSKFVRKTTSVRVPPGARRIRVVVTATRQDGGYADAYFDNLSLVLNAPKPKPPALKIVQRCIGHASAVFVSSRARLTQVSFWINGQQRGTDRAKPFFTGFLLTRPAKLKIVATAVVLGQPTDATRTVRLRACA